VQAPSTQWYASTAPIPPSTVRHRQVIDVKRRVFVHIRPHAPYQLRLLCAELSGIDPRAQLLIARLDDHFPMPLDLVHEPVEPSIAIATQKFLPHFLANLLSTATVNSNGWRCSNRST
jgi:hypothetical protein